MAMSESSSYHQQFDYIIVETGPAGAVMAKTLKNDK